MNLKDFFDKNPGLLSQFKKCTSKDDFMSVAQANNIRFGSGKLDEVYEYIKAIEDGSEASNSINDDALEMASGGASAPTFDINELEKNTTISQLDMGMGDPITLIN